jgi:hypothetical protein
MKLIAVSLLCAATVYGQGSKTPIYNGILQTDLDANGFSILNLAGGGGAGLPPMTGHGSEFLTNNGVSTALWGPAYIVSITDPVDPTKQFQFDLSAFPTATTRQLSIAPGGNSTTVIPAPGGGNNVVKGITSAGVVTLGQLAFSNLSGVATTAQGGMLTGGLNGQVLAKSSGSDYALQWLNLTGGGNVSSVATPVNGQLAQWTGPTTIQGLSAVPTTAAGLPTLGTTGQVLSKIDGTSYNTQWVTLPGGGNVISVGTPSANQIAQWTDSTHAQGIAAVPIAQGGTGAATAAAGTVFGNNSNVTAAPAFVINPRITAISNLTTDGFVTTNSGIGTLSVDTTDYEPALGNPASNGYVLSSTTAGVRSWVAGGGGGGGLTSVPAGKTIFVDGTSGNNSTGVRGDEAKPFLTISAATAIALAGDTIFLRPGTYTENTTGVELPNDVSMTGSGRGVSVIQSTMLGSASPFHGVVAPGNNSVIRDLSIIGVSPSGTGNEHVNAISRRSGATKSWTNVLIQNCHLYGLADCVIAGAGISLGNMTFIDCLLEAQNDVFMWQSPTDAVLINCELRHTTTGGANLGLGGNGIYDGGAGGTVKAYGCRYTLGGSIAPTGAMYPLSADSHVEAYDFVIDYRGLSGSMTGKDLQSATAGALFVSNVRRADLAPLTVDNAFGAIKEYSNMPPHTVAKLPASPVAGQTSIVTDGAASLAYNATVTGGGSTKYLVMYNGTNWVVVGGGTVAGGGNVSNSGTPTVGQYGRWVTAATIEGVSTSTVKTDLAISNVTNDAQIKASDFPSTSVDGEISLFSGTTGKAQKRATGTGVVTATSGVYGTVTAPAGAIVGTTDTQILTNKEIAPRISSQASNATWSPNADTTDVFVLTLQAAAATTIDNPSGTAVDGQKLIIRAKCDGTARALTWTGSQWRGSTDVALPSTLTASKTMYMGFIWNATDSRWDIVAKTDGF